MYIEAFNLCYVCVLYLILNPLPHIVCRVLREVVSETVDVKVNKGKTETIQVNVEGAVFSEFPGTKVHIMPCTCS